MVQYIGISGYARSGKDSVANILTEGYGFKRFAFADKLKQVVAVLNPLIVGEQHLDQILAEYGPERAKDEFPEYRRLLQVMGTEVGRKFFGDNIWVDIALAQVRPHEKAVFTDCRFPNEAEAIKERGGQVWRVQRPGFGPANSHASETSLDAYKFDHYIRNTGTLADLHHEVKVALQSARLRTKGIKT